MFRRNIRISMFLELMPRATDGIVSAKILRGLFSKFVCAGGYTPAISIPWIERSLSDCCVKIVDLGELWHIVGSSC